jgi:Ca-activated chloride channel family protein
VKRWLYAGSAWLLALAWTGPVAAELPQFLRKENAHVRDGNEALNRGDAKGALESYTRAARELPDSAGVQLDRGLALLKQGEFAKARESLLAATQPSAPSDLRADAYEDLALAFYREADGFAKQNKHEEAQKLFRESVDAAKRSLRLRPGDPNTAWNLELAARRIREEEAKQKQEDDKRKQDEKNKDQDKDKDKDKSQDPKDQKQDQKQDGDKNQDPNKPDSDKDKNADKDQKPEPSSNDKKDKPEDKQPQKPDSQAKPEQPAPSPKPDPAKQDEPKEGEAPPEKALPPEAAQALDALEGGEENFERYRARQRAARERRAPEKDW